jgi:uncharacterized repeat protein (TIGR01451 family)
VTYGLDGHGHYPHPLTNQATIAAPGHQTLTRTATVTVTPPPAEVDLRPSYKRVYPSQAYYGERVTYTVGIVNADGPLDQVVYFTDTLPDGLTYVPGSLSATRGDYDDAGAPTLTWSGTLSPTRAVTVTYWATVTFNQQGSSFYPWPVTNQATIVAPGNPPLTRTASVTVTQPPVEVDLSPSYKRVYPSQAEHGERVTYTVGIVNADGPLAQMIYFTDTLPDGLTYVPGSLSATRGTYSDAAAPTLTWSGLLSPTPAVTLTYAAVITYFGQDTAILPRAVVNNAEIASPASPLFRRTATLQANWQYWKRMYLPLALKSYQVR